MEVQKSFSLLMNNKIMYKKQQASVKTRYVKSPALSGWHPHFQRNTRIKWKRKSHSHLSHPLHYDPPYFSLSNLAVKRQVLLRIVTFLYGFAINSDFKFNRTYVYHRKCNHISLKLPRKWNAWKISDTEV